MIPFYYLSNTTVPAGETIEALYAWMKPIMLCMLVGTLLGVVIKLPFSMAFYILADEPQLKGTQALKKSAQLMKGDVYKRQMKQGEYKEKVAEFNGKVVTMIRVKD